MVTGENVLDIAPKDLAAMHYGRMQIYESRGLTEKAEKD